MLEFPLIRVEIDYIKQALVTALSGWAEKLPDYVSQHVESAIQNYPWETEVKKVIHEEIKREIEQYWKHGDGSTTIRNAVIKAFKERKNHSD